LFGVTHSILTLFFLHYDDDSQQSNDFIRHLPNASLIALDEEMTGIMLPPGMAPRPSKDDTPTLRYPILKQVPERYAMIQLGICLFEKQEPATTTTSTNATASPSAASDNHAHFHVVRYILLQSSLVYNPIIIIIRVDPD
jgi:hypothetical protein